MSLDSESSPSSSRDWFFPPQSFVHSHPAKSHNYIRRFSETSRISRRYTDYQSYRKTSSSISASHSSSTTTNDVKFARTRRRFDFDRRSDLSIKPSEVEFSSKRKLELPDVSSSAKKLSDASRLVRPIDSTLKVRWHFLAIAVSIFVVIFATMVHENLSLQEQVNDLETRIFNLNIKLRACNSFGSGSEDDVRSPDELADVVTDKRLKTLALIASLTLLLAPIIVLKYIDYISKSRSLDHNLEEVSLNKRLAYKVDVFFSIHPYAKPLALLIATLLLIMLGGLALFGVTDDSLVDCLWLSWTYVADAGNHANSEGIGPRLVSVSVSFGGMLIFAMMLGLVSDSISEKFDSLRKGRSEVVEQNHTLILGWSDKLGSLLNQISIANESLGGGTVVVMAERDKEEMELDIAKMEFDFKGTSVICRSGSPLILADLKKVSVSKARAIIVIAEDGNADQSDARALRTVLSLTGVKEGLGGHIVVELGDLDNEVLVKLVGGELVETVVAHDVIGRLMIQCARQPGLAQIWEDILGFENCEFYIKRWPQLVGMQFEDVLISFPDAIPCGIKVASRGGKIVLNPEDSYVLEEGDEVLVIAEDDDTYAPAALPTVLSFPCRNFLISILRPFTFCYCIASLSFLVVVFYADASLGILQSCPGVEFGRAIQNPK